VECPNVTAKCLCSSTKFQADAAHCIKTSCTTQEDQQNAYNFAVQVCDQVGITLPSFSAIAQSSMGAVIRLGSRVSIGVRIAAALFVVGLL